MNDDEHIYTKLMNYGETTNCYEAIREECECRCRGVLHGMSHIAFCDAFNELLSMRGTVSASEAFDLAWDVAARMYSGKGEL